MTKTFFFCSLLVVCFGSCGPGEPKSVNTAPDFDPLISPVKEYVQQTDLATDLTIKTLDFTEGTTTGKYTAYLKGGEIVKLVTDGIKADGTKHWVFYLQNHQLMLAHINETSKNCYGTKFCAWEIKNYFLNGHLIKSIKRGDAFINDQEANVQEKKFTQNTDDDLMQMDTTQQQYAGYVIALFNQQKK